MQKPTIALITLTNKGYLKYTYNCVKSLDDIGLKKQIRCYAIGKEAYGRLTQKGTMATLIDDEENTGFQFFRRGNWKNVVFYKFEIIHQNLSNYDFVCFTDGDIVFEDSYFLQYCIDHICKIDLLIQNDTMDDESNCNLCAGFMFIKSNKNTLKIFDPGYVKENSTIHEKWGDQTYINEIKNKLNYKLLPLTLFPNGRYYRKNHKTLKPLLIHFNWVVGHGKSYHIVRYMKFKSISLLFKFLPDAIFFVAKNRIQHKKHIIKKLLRKLSDTLI